MNYTIAVCLMDRLSKIFQSSNHNSDDSNSGLEDEQLARGIEEGLTLGYPPFSYENGNYLQPVPVCYVTHIRARISDIVRICAYCKTEIANGRYLSCLNEFWHPECIPCCICYLPIFDYEFSASVDSEGYPYHKICIEKFSKPHDEKCDVCMRNQFSKNGDVFAKHPFFNQKFCPSHCNDGTPSCYSCARMKPQERRYVDLDDGRKLCLECLDSAIMNTEKCEPLYIAIKKFYEGLDMKLDAEIPLFLDDQQQLDEATTKGEKNGHYDKPEARGCCVLEEQSDTTTTVSAFGNGIGCMRIQHKVIAIHILYGLPRLATGSILAHEMMHAWLRLQGYPILKEDVEEGLCQVMSHMWLEAELCSASNTSREGETPQFEGKFGEFMKHEIESDPTHAYGYGFRTCHSAVGKYGLKNTLHHVRMTGKIPI